MGAAGMQDSSTADEDGGGGSRQNWMEKSGLWPMLHLERQGISQVKSWHACGTTNSVKASKGNLFIWITAICKIYFEYFDAVGWV